MEIALDKHTSVYINTMPFGYPFNFQNYLFNQFQYLSLQENANRHDFFLVNHHKKRIEGRIHFFEHNEKALSPLKALFGGFEFNHRFRIDMIDQWAWQIIQYFREKKMKGIQIVMPAECYWPEKFENIHEVLLNYGFKVAHDALNHHIPVKEEGMFEHMHQMEKRKLDKCRNEGLVFREEGMEQFDEVWQHLIHFRKEKDIPVSIGRDGLKKAIATFPANYRLFTVRHLHDIYAVSVAVRVNREILYNFLPASSLAHQTLSPSVMLYDGLYDYARKNGYEMLDLGISTKPNGEHQEGLIAFKEHLGGIPSRKYTYFLEL
jgi:hypothetical protein